MLRLLKKSLTVGIIISSSEPSPKAPLVPLPQVNSLTCLSAVTIPESFSMPKAILWDKPQEISNI